MRAANVFLAYAPRGIGLRCVAAYLAAGRDAYGWFLGPTAEAVTASRFFFLEDFYSNREARYEEIDEAQLHTPWSLAEDRRHEVAIMREMVAREWLFYRDDPRALAELEAYAEAELAAGEVNIRIERLAKFSTLQPNWTFYSPGFERAVLHFLAKRWPLDYSPEGD